MRVECAGKPRAGLFTLLRAEERMVDRYLEDGIIEGGLDDDAYEQNFADAYPPLDSHEAMVLPTGVISVTTRPA